MKVERIVREELSFKPGDMVTVADINGCKDLGRIVRIVENVRRSYVVINVLDIWFDVAYTAWRPISTYGKTWWKDDEDYE